MSTTEEPVDVGFMPPLERHPFVEGPSLRLPIADLEAWLRSLPIDYPAEPARCSEVHISAEDGVSVTYLTSLEPFVLTTVHCPVVSWGIEA